MTARWTKADARADIVRTFEAWRAEGAPLVSSLKAFASDYGAGLVPVAAGTRETIPTASWNSIQRWHKAFLANGTAGVVAETGGRKSIIESDPDFAADAAALLIVNPHHVTARQIGELLAARYPDREQPGVDSIRRFCRKWRKENARAVSAVADPDGHRSRRQPAFGDATAVAAADGLNSLWELDSTTADVMCADGKRYALVAAIDVWSRRARVYVSPTSRSTAICALLRRAVIEWGVPGRIRTDEGADYTSRHVRRALRDLGIDHQPLPPYSPDKKPFIERFIGTLSRDFLTRLPGFTGHNVADAARLRGRKSFAGRRGETAAEVFGCSLGPEELQEKIDAWCAAVYGRRKHSGLDCSPFERAASWTGERRFVDERALDALLADGGTRVVSKKGVQIDGGFYIAAALGAMVGERVQVRQDAADWGRVQVFTDEADTIGRWVCTAEDPMRTGIDREEAAREAKRLHRDAASAARAMARDLAEQRSPASAADEVLTHAVAQSERVVAFPAAGAEHTSNSVLAAVTAAESAGADAKPAAEPPKKLTDAELLKRFHAIGATK